MILYFGQPAHDADENLFGTRGNISAQTRSALVPIRVNIQVDTERNHSELFAPPDVKLLVDFLSLLFTDNYDSVRHAREHAFDRQKDSRFGDAVITVKDVPVICVNEAARTRSSRDSRWG